MDETFRQADSVATSQILVAVLTELGDVSPEIRAAIYRGFDTAANVCERLSIERGEAGRHFTTALELIEQMRLTIEKGH